MKPFELHRNDLWPPIRVQAADGRGYAEPLASAVSVRFRMRLRGSLTFKVDAPAIVEDANTGLLRYLWLPGDTDTLGFYQGWFVVQHVEGPQTYPVKPHIIIR